MKVNKALNFVVPVPRDDSAIYVHSTPVSREVFEQYHRPLARAFTTLMSNYGVMSGPRIAAMELREVAQNMGVWEGPEGVENGLMNEIRRLASVILPNDVGGGWQTLPYATVIERKLLDDDEQSEVENGIIFFIVCSAMLRREEKRAILEGAARYWNAQVVSLNVTEFMSSLPTSTVIASSGEKAPTVLVPS